MKKKLLAAAVAGAFALPGMAFAQSAVTISGYIKVGLENLNIGSISSAHPRPNSSEWRLYDSSSRIDFHMKEDLGNGLSAIGLFDLRFNATTGAGGASGNDWVGLEGDQWGRVTIGRRDLHYYHTADTFPGGARALDAWSVAILGFVQDGSHNLPIANDTRTNNTIEYTSPKWGLFTFSLAYSTDPYSSSTYGYDTNSFTGLTNVPVTVSNSGSMIPSSAAGVDSVVGTNAANSQNAYAWNFAPQLRGANWVAGYSYYKAHSPAGSYDPNQTSNRLWGYYVFPQGFRVGLTFDQSKLDSTVAGQGEIAKRNAWSVPVSYTFGPNEVGLTYTKAGNNKAPGAASDSGAKMIALDYQYSLSKLTQVGVTYARINNDANANYNLFASTGLGTADGGISNGEKPRMIQFTLMHAF